MRVTLDTNIYVSALEWGGKPMQLVEMGMDGKIEIAISQPIIDETLRVLRDKFEWSAADLQDAVRVMEGCARRVEAEESVDVITYDLPDNRILECAQAAASDFIVSGDKDLLRLGKFGEARILKAAELLGIAKGKGQER